MNSFRLALLFLTILIVPSLAIAECNDGIDNDNDGLVDWEYDLGCYNQTDTSEGGIATMEKDNGWTVFEPSPDTRIIYVSSSEGDDSNDGLSPSTPKASVYEGVRLLRRGYPDWLLFKRGDVFDSRLGLNENGRSMSEPIVIGSYGDSTTRPLFRVPSGGWIANSGGSCGGKDPICGYMAVVGLHVRMETKDPNSDLFNGTGGSVVAILGNGGGYLFEDNKFEYGQFNIMARVSEGITDTFVVRRNSFSKNYSVNSHAQNLFVGAGTPWKVLVEENTFYHGGWNNEFRFVVTPGSSDPTTWASITDGHFDIVLAGERFSIDGVNFTGVSAMQHVANRLNSAINTAIGARSVNFKHSGGGVFFLTSDDFHSHPDYKIEDYTGSNNGTNIATESLLLGSKVGVPESTVFNRNLYINGDGTLTLRGNVVADSASGAQIRGGGIMEHNLFLRSAYQFNTSGPIRYNVQLDSKDIDTQPQGGGFNLFSQNRELDYISVHHNIVAHNTSGTAIRPGITMGYGEDTDDIPINIYKNIVYNWIDGDEPEKGSGLQIKGISARNPLLNIRDNIFYQPTAGTVAVISDLSSIPNITLSNNSYYSGDEPSEWFRLINQYVSLADWVAQTGETGATVKDTPFTDPDRTIITYMDSLGLGGGYDEFIRLSLSQSRFNFDTRLMANSVNDYIREGLDLELPDGVTYEVVESGNINPPRNLKIQ